MSTRKGRRIAIAAVVRVVGLGGALIWAGWDHIEFMLAVESVGGHAQGYDQYLVIGCLIKARTG